MKELYNRIIAILISIFIMVFSLLFIFSDKKVFSENENRYLQTFPKLTMKNLKDGSYTSKLQGYLSDHFIGRDTFMSIKTSYEKISGKKEINEVYLAKDNYLIEKYHKAVNNDKIIASLNNLYHELNYINMNLMLVPTSITINKDKLPKNAVTNNQLDTIKYIYDNIEFNTIDIYSTLMEHNKKYQMFYYLDHHWTTYAAYYAYQVYCDNNLLESIPIYEFDVKEVTDDFNGTLYSKSNDYSRKSDAITLFLYDKYTYSVNYVSKDIIKDSLYEMDYLNTKDKYSVFLDNNHPLVVVTNNEVNTKLEIAVIKDSYANSMIPFLANHYKKVHIIDPRFYKLSIAEYIKDKPNIKDMLILYNINTIDEDNGIVTIN